MALSLLKPTRTVAQITDEALCLYSSGIKGVRLVETVPWDAESFERNVASIISKDCGGRPVLILNDMVEISFRKERIPRVGVMDKNSVVLRKLNLAFPSYPVKAALLLKEKAVKGEKTPAAGVYIFAAVPASTALSKTIAAIRRSLAPVAGFGLVPTESSDMVKTLAMRQKQKNKNAWSIFVGQHANGSLRQIVTKNGELALTRMTPVADMTNDPKGWLRDVTQEMKATMSYLSRFGYSQDEGLNVFVISNKEVGEALEEMIGIPCNYVHMTVAEAAKILNLPLGRAGEQNYADILHVAWAGTKSKLVMPMRANILEAVSRPRQIAVIAAVILFLGAAFLAYQSFDQFYDISMMSEDIDSAMQKKAQVDVQYEKEVQRKKAIGFDVKLVQSSLAVYEDLDKHNVRLMKMVAGIGNAMGRDLKIDKISLQRIEDAHAEEEMGVDDGSDDENADDSSGDDDAGNGATNPDGTPVEAKTPLFEATLQMSFPSTTDVLRGNQEVKDFRDRIQQLLPDSTISVTKFLKDYKYTNQLVVETGDLKKADLSQDFLAEITIKGVAP